MVPTDYILNKSAIEEKLPIQESNRRLSINKIPTYLSSRFKRSSQHIVTECIFMTSEEGEFYHKATTVDGSACGIYIVAEPNQKVEVRFNYFDVPCSNGGLVAFVDGWELNGELFPTPRDYPLPSNTRFREFCDEKKIKQIFVSSSNVALIQYRMPYRGSGFTITVRFIKNPTPCNTLLQGFEEVYTLKNYEKRSNCSVSTLFPSAVRIEAINVGVVRADLRSMEMEIGTIHKCQKRGLEDYVQIGGSTGLDNSNLIIADSVCGLNSRPGRFEEFIACGTTTVRLVSSGAFDNSVTVHLRQLDGEEDMNSFMSVLCPIEEIRK
ncbi:hypothetical protein WA026_019705 [Henosepilachna vigintioctopunctata]|uniref:Corticotropin-releasing factor-binding protein n=1 Tax=Henosepilachna vigintioctopunctata TaxID=420089 RepID=A0AAW1ULV7_9CUCU